MANPVQTVILDVGAGLKSLYAVLLRQSLGLKIHAVEPHPELAQSLRELNLGPRLIIHEVALVEEDPADGKCKFYCCSDRSCSSTLPLELKNVRRWLYPLGRRFMTQTKVIDVKAMTLETLINTTTLPRNITLLNLDVQGCALNVLRGIKTRPTWECIKEINVKVHLIEWELYQGQSKNYDVMELCLRHYFRLQAKTTKSRDQEDVLSFRNELAVMKKWPFERNGWAARLLAAHE